jgi:hypothetical protein
MVDLDKQADLSTFQTSEEPELPERPRTIK